VVDRVLEAGTDGEWHVPVRNCRRIFHGRSERGEIARAERRVDRLEPLMFGTTLIVGLHDMQSRSALAFDAKTTAYDDTIFNIPDVKA
jgi:hypothetical protein